MSTIPLTPAQIRAGRALLDWSQDQLANKAGVGLSTVRDYEKERRTGDMVGGMRAIKLALENEGVVFLTSEADLGPGARLKAKVPNVLRWPSKLGRYEELLIPVEWRGKNYAVLVMHEVLDDIGHFRHSQETSEYLRVFEQYRGAILEAAAKAIDAGKVDTSGRVLLKHDDFSDWIFR